MLMMPGLIGTDELFIFEKEWWIIFVIKERHFMGSPSQRIT